MGNRNKYDILFKALAANKSIYAELLEYWIELHTEATTKLNRMAISSLVSEDMKAPATIQLGRVQLLNEIVLQFEKYSKQQEHNNVSSGR